MGTNAYVSALPVFDDQKLSMRMDFRVIASDETVSSAAPPEDRDRSTDARPQPSTELLMPDMGIFKDRFALVVSRHVFDGWVLQPSPCCAAASVAGAANAALGLPHDDELALSHAHIAALYHAMLADQTRKKTEVVARLLGIDSIEPALEALRAQLRAEGRSLGGRKEEGCKAKEAMARLRVLCEDAMCAEDGDHIGGAGGAQVAWGTCITTDAEAEAQMWAALSEVLPPLPLVSTGAGCEDDEDDENVAENLLHHEVGTVSGGGFGVKVRSELKTLLTKLGGHEQLTPSNERPSTWAIGNWGMHSAVRALRGPAFEEGDAVFSVASESDPRLASLRANAAESGRAALCSLLRCRTLVGQRCKGQAAPPPIVLRKADDDGAIEAAWVALKAAFSQPRCCLILHQKGHYALVFAMREWVEDTVGDGMTAEPPRRVRELLTCRKGQRPTLWVDWTEVHGFIAGWSGYAIMEVSAVPP